MGLSSYTPDARGSSTQCDIVVEKQSGKTPGQVRVLPTPAHRLCDPADDCPSSPDVADA